jgi:uracil-DNA glycosylase family 4
VAYRHAQRKLHPDWFNAPVPVFGTSDSRLLITGLAPGVAGANRTGRPFTGDFAGDLLYRTLIRFGFATGTFRADPHDGLTLEGTMIANAVRCVPPQNKPLPAEIKTCNQFLRARISALPELKAIVALGRIAHDAVLTAHEQRKSSFPFTHGGEHQIGGLRLFDSYHCSRYNTNTGVLTEAMFAQLFARVRAYLDRPGA